MCLDRCLDRGSCLLALSMFVFSVENREGTSSGPSKGGTSLGIQIDDPPVAINHLRTSFQRIVSVRTSSWRERPRVGGTWSPGRPWKTRSAPGHRVCRYLCSSSREHSSPWTVGSAHERFGKGSTSVWGQDGCVEGETDVLVRGCSLKTGRVRRRASREGMLIRSVAWSE